MSLKFTAIRTVVSYFVLHLIVYLCWAHAIFLIIVDIRYFIFIILYLHLDTSLYIVGFDLNYQLNWLNSIFTQMHFSSIFSPIFHISHCTLIYLVITISDLYADYICYMFFTWKGTWGFRKSHTSSAMVSVSLCNLFLLGFHIDSYLYVLTFANFMYAGS